MKRKLDTNPKLLTKILADYPSTFKAFLELVNNAIQAKAKNIKISIDQTKEEDFTDLVIREIIIEDDGFGVPESEFDVRILEIANDHKVAMGGFGIGRFAAFQLGDNIDIETVSFDKAKNKFTYVQCLLGKDDIIKSNLDKSEIYTKEEILAGEANPYYRVRISSFHNSLITEKEKKRKIDSNLLIENLPNALFEFYTSKIFNGDIVFTVNNVRLTKDNFVVGEKTVKNEVFKDEFGKEHNFVFTFYPVKHSNKAVKVYLTANNGGIETNISELDYDALWLPPDAPNYFIYIHSDYFATDIQHSLETDFTLNNGVKAIKSFIKEKLNSNFAKKYKEYSSFAEQLKKDKYYPYREVHSSSKTKEAVFTKFAYYIENNYYLLKKGEELRKVIYALIDKSITNGYLEDVLSSIVSMSKQSIEKFHNLIKIAPIESIIEFSEQVAQKSKFIDILYELTYGDISKKIKERSELHKLVEKQLWIFGEGYANTPLIGLHSDKNLENNLDELRKMYFTFQPDKKEGNIDLNVKGKSKNITDLFFYNMKMLDNEAHEVMIVELKAPKCKIGTKEITQVEKYADQVMNSPKFSKSNSFKIILVSSDVTEFVKNKLTNMEKPIPKNPFCYYKTTDGRIEIWIMTWAEVIDLNRKKLSYLGQALKLKETNTLEQVEQELEDISTDKIKSKLQNSKKSKQPELVY